MFAMIEIYHIHGFCSIKVNFKINKYINFNDLYTNIPKYAQQLHMNNLDHVNDV